MAWMCYSLNKNLRSNQTRPNTTHKLSLVTRFFDDRGYITRWNCAALDRPAVMLAFPDQFLDWDHLPDCSLQVAHSPHWDANASVLCPWSRWVAERTLVSNKFALILQLPNPGKDVCNHGNGSWLSPRSGVISHATSSPRSPDSCQLKSKKAISALSFRQRKWNNTNSHYITLT